MDIGHIRLSKNRDFYGLRVPRGLFEGLVGAARGVDGAPVKSMVLDLEHREREVRGVRVDGAPVRVIGFPQAHQVLVSILIGARDPGANDTVEVLLSRRTFDRLADEQGAQRLKRLDLKAGQASEDGVLRHLGACLDHALHTPSPAAGAVDQFTTSVTVRIAQLYGDMQPLEAQHGGLRPWQLRLARSAFDEHLDGSVSLEDLAARCGLSVSHFSRAFRRSTGLAPHRWLMQRRIEVAKDMMLAESVPLAQVAVACGFADQSHFTRTFAALIGLTPARWRLDQERSFAVS